MSDGVLHAVVMYERAIADRWMTEAIAALRLNAGWSGSVALLKTPSLDISPLKTSLVCRSVSCQHFVLDSRKFCWRKEQLLIKLWILKNTKIFDEEIFVETFKPFLRRKPLGQQREDQATAANGCSWEYGVRWNSFICIWRILLWKAEVRIIPFLGLILDRDHSMIITLWEYLHF